MRASPLHLARAVVLSAITVALLWFSPLSSPQLAFAESQNNKGQLSSSPVDLRFHQVVVGQHQTIPVTMTNTGGANVTVTGIEQSTSGFHVQGLTLPFTLRVGRRVQFQVTFAPQALGHVDDEIAFLSNASNNPYYIHAHGNGVPVGSLTADPATIGFGNVQTGGNQTEYPHLINNSSSRVTISRARVEGSGFSISGLDVPATLDPGHSITFSATFSPQSEGKSSGYIAIESDAPNPRLRIGLSGTGTAAGALSVTPQSMDFGQVNVGDSQNRDGALQASGGDITVTSAVVGNAEFSLSGISLPVTIPAGQRATFTITFAPTAGGRVSTSVSFVSNAANSPALSKLTGTGTHSQHAVDLTWKASKSRDVAGYNIYRSEQRHGRYEKLNDSLEPSTGYTDSTVQGGHTYFYATTAVDLTGSESHRSNRAKAVIPSP